MRFNHKAFFTGYREHFGGSDGVSQQEVTGLSRLLAGIEHDPHVKRIDDAAYMLATSKHETAHTFHPIHEYGGKNYFIKRYGGQTRKGKELGNDTPEEGYYYAGKGDVQLTGESNYEKAEDAIRKEYPELVAAFEKRTGRKFDLTVGDQPGDERDPDNAMDPAISYAIMSFGMRHGMFTGRKMSQYHGKPFSAWRPIINGTDHADDIAKIARGFEKILTDAYIDDETPEWEEGELPAPKPAPAAPSGPQPAIPEQIVTPPTVAIPVQTVTTEKKEETDAVKEELTKWSARWMTIPASVLGTIGAAVTWALSAPVNLTIAILIVTGVIVVVYTSIRQISQWSDRAAQRRADREEAARKHEIQMALINSAASKTQNTVALVPPPVELPSTDPEVQNGDTQN
jgi:putative chitinase